MSKYIPWPNDLQVTNIEGEPVIGQNGAPLLLPYAVFIDSVVRGASAALDPKPSQSALVDLRARAKATEASLDVPRILEVTDIEWPMVYAESDILRGLNEDIRLSAVPFTKLTRGAFESREEAVASVTPAST